MSDRAVDPSSG
ncbi:MAG: hypothetical protein EZS28_031157, partial [Streblomastix strix]